MSCYRLVVFVFCAYCIRLGAGRSTHVIDEKAFEKGIRFFFGGDPNDQLPKDGGVSIFINNIVYQIKTLGGNKYINIKRVHGNSDEFNELQGYHEFDQDEVNNDKKAGNESNSSEIGVDWKISNTSFRSEKDLSTTSENYVDTTREGNGSSISEEVVETPLNNKEGTLASDIVDNRKINETNVAHKIKENKQYSTKASKINSKHKVKSKSKHSSNDENDYDIPKTMDRLKSKVNEVNDMLSANEGLRQSYKKSSVEKAIYTKDSQGIRNKYDKKVLQEKNAKSGSNVTLLLKSTKAGQITKHDFVTTNDSNEEGSSESISKM